MTRTITLMVCFLIPIFGSSVFAADHRPIALENWETHPDVKEVRAIYDEINRGIKNKKYKTRVRRWNINTEICSGAYPIENKMLVLDGKGRVRKYHYRQQGSDQELFDVDHYYDINGHLRFVFVDRTIQRYRIYFNREGKVFWATETESFFDNIHNDKITRYEAGDGDWETKPNNPQEAKEAFEAQEPCPEIKK